MSVLLKDIEKDSNAEYNLTAEYFLEKNKKNGELRIRKDGKNCVPKIEEKGLRD